MYYDHLSVRCWQIYSSCASFCLSADWHQGQAFSFRVSAQLTLSNPPPVVLNGRFNPIFFSSFCPFAALFVSAFPSPAARLCIADLHLISLTAILHLCSDPLSFSSRSLGNTFTLNKSISHLFLLILLSNSLPLCFLCSQIVLLPLCQPKKKSWLSSWCYNYTWFITLISSKLIIHPGMRIRQSVHQNVSVKGTACCPKRRINDPGHWCIMHVASSCTSEHQAHTDNFNNWLDWNGVSDLSVIFRCWNIFRALLKWNMSRSSLLVQLLFIFWEVTVGGLLFMKKTCHGRWAVVTLFNDRHSVHVLYRSITL